jgi:hypothetical protein
MTAQRPIPLRPDASALARSERRSFVRACTAIALGSKSGADPGRIVGAFDDPRAELIVRAASAPASTGNSAALMLQSTRILPLLAPAAASARLLALATSLDLSGLQTIRLPFVGLAGRTIPTPFVAEGDPGSVVDLTLSATALGPTRKLLILSALTREMTAASAENAEVIIGDALALSAEQSLDAALFSNAAATETAPAGILNGLTPIASAATTGADGVADDLALLAAAIGAAGINPDGMTIVTTPSLAVKIRVLASPLFANVVLSSSSLADGTVIAIVPQGLATGYDGGVTVEASTEAVVHFENTMPAPIVDDTGVVAAPTYSAFQTDMTILKIRGNAAWTVRPGAVATISGAAW